MAPKATVQLSLIVEGSFSWSCISVYLYHPSFKPVLILDHMYIYRDWVEIIVFLRILFENVRDLLKNYLLIAFILKHVHCAQSAESQIPSLQSVVLIAGVWGKQSWSCLFDLSKYLKREYRNESKSCYQRYVTTGYQQRLIPDRIFYQAWHNLEGNESEWRGRFWPTTYSEVKHSWAGLFVGRLLPKSHCLLFFLAQFWDLNFSYNPKHTHHTSICSFR